MYMNTLKYHKELKKVTHIDITIAENINSLEKIDFFICERTYTYNKAELLDTICENVGISDKHFPCAVKIKYYLKNGEEKLFKTDSFNCAGCSGSNSYSLFDDSVEYLYTP